MPGLLPYQDIKRRLEQGELLTNWIEPCISAVSYELRIGSWVDERSREVIPMRENETYGLAPGQFVHVGVIEEVFELPHDIAGFLYLRSTFGRRGFADWQKGLVDPGYSGSLTIPLHNTGKSVIRLVGHERAVHITFEEMLAPTERPYRGAYQNSKGPTASRYDDEIIMIGRNI